MSHHNQALFIGNNNYIIDEDSDSNNLYPLKTPVNDVNLLSKHFQ
jgi:hypothetical protein